MSVVKSVLSFGGSCLVTDLVMLFFERNITPQNLKEKIVILGGSAILGGIAGAKAGAYVENEIDGIEETVKKLKKLNAEKKMEEAKYVEAKEK